MYSTRRAFYYLCGAYRTESSCSAYNKGMAKNDPTDNGGLFIGRRPGTGPIRWRSLPQPGSPLRRRLDWVLAVFILLCMSLIVLSFWGPVPLLGLWFGSQVQYWLSSPGLGLLMAFVLCLTCYLGGLLLLKRMDRAWILVRRAAGQDQRSGILNRIVGFSSLLGAIVFSAWLILFSGAQLAPVGIHF